MRPRKAVRRAKSPPRAHPRAGCNGRRDSLVPFAQLPYDGGLPHWHRLWSRRCACSVDRGDRECAFETLTGHRFVPTVVGLDKSGALHVGDSARRQLCLAGTLGGNLRRYVGTTQRLELDRKRFSATELCAVVLKPAQRLGRGTAGQSTARRDDRCAMPFRTRTAPSDD